MKVQGLLPWAGVAMIVVGFVTLQDRAAGLMQKERALPNCPVMGEPVNLAVSTETPEGPVYFCCAGCIKKYKNTPDKYASAVAEQRKTLAAWPKVQVRCPLDSKPVDSAITAESEGHKVHFCSKECMAKYQAEPAKYASGLANSYTHQTTCPISDHPIDPKTATKLATGETVYFCCDKCDEKFLAKPEDFVAKLEQQGIMLNLEKLKAAKSGG